jgi:hypothetical protein
MRDEFNMDSFMWFSYRIKKVNSRAYTISSSGGLSYRNIKKSLIGEEYFTSKKELIIHHIKMHAASIRRIRRERLEDLVSEITPIEKELAFLIEKLEHIDEIKVRKDELVLGVASDGVTLIKKRMNKKLDMKVIVKGRRM